METDSNEMKVLNNKLISMKMNRTILLADLEKTHRLSMEKRKAEINEVINSNLSKAIDCASDVYKYGNFEVNKLKAKLKDVIERLTLLNQELADNKRVFKYGIVNTKEYFFNLIRPDSNDIFENVNDFYSLVGKCSTGILIKDCLDKFIEINTVKDLADYMEGISNQMLRHLDVTNLGDAYVFNKYLSKKHLAIETKDFLGKEVISAITYKESKLEIKPLVIPPRLKLKHDLEKILILAKGALNEIEDIALSGPKVLFEQSDLKELIEDSKATINKDETSNKLVMKSLLHASAIMDVCIIGILSTHDLVSAFQSYLRFMRDVTQEA